MIAEILLLCGCTYLYKNWWKIKLKIKFKDIVKSNSKFTNKSNTSITCYMISKEEYGYKLFINLPYSYTLKDLYKDIDIFKEGLKLNSLQIENDKHISLNCICNYEFKDYKPIRYPPNKLLICSSLTSHICVDINKFPHVLIGGDTGTGKSRILLLILTNLIHYNKNIDIHLLQLRKNDLGVFNNCMQIKSICNNLNDILNTLININNECIRRESLIDNTKGIYNIEDYIKKHGDLHYVYVVIEEFSFLNKSQGDSKQEKILKQQCLKYIKTIVNVGRSSGVFLITALQKPTADSIPSDIKSQLCTRISLRIEDPPTSKVILGDESASKLSEREVIVKTNTKQYGYSYTINHQMIMENIKNSIINKKIKITNTNDNLDNILEALDEINR